MEKEVQTTANPPYAPEGLRQPGYFRRTAEKVRQGGRIVLKWSRPEWVKRRAPRKRQNEEVRRKVNESRSGVQTFLTMAHIAIDRAVDTEPNVQVRRDKVRQMRKVWREYQSDLLGVARR